MTPAPLDVRVARVIGTPLPFLAYFLIRVPQVTEGGYVPWAEAVPIVILTMGMFPLWLYWCADLVSWRRARPTPVDEIDATSGTFTGELPGVMQGLPKGADGRFAAVPVHTATNYLTQAANSGAWLAEQHDKLTAAGATLAADGETYVFPVKDWQYVGLTDGGVTAKIEYFNPMADPWFADSIRAMGKDPEKMVSDDRPTEPILLTHEFIPAAGIAMDVTGGNEWLERELVRPGRHRAKPRTHLPPLDEVENADAYSQINRTRELPF